MSEPTLKMTHGAIGEAMCCYTEGSYKDADIALTEYEKLIQADAIRKFAVWLSNNGYLGREDNNPQSFTEHYWEELDVDTVLNEYENEQVTGEDNVC